MDLEARIREELSRDDEQAAALVSPVVENFRRLFLGSARLAKRSGKAPSAETLQALVAQVAAGLRESLPGEAATAVVKSYRRAKVRR